MRRLKGLRLEKGLAIRDLAETVNIHRVELSGMESGRVNPTPEELQRLGEVLGCPADRLLDHIDAGHLGAGAEARADQQEKA